MALFLTALGLYGVVAYFVALKTREIGIRVAIGASPGRVAVLILGKGMSLVSAGLVLGFAGALGATTFVEDYLFQTAARDPLTFVGVGVFFTFVALVSCLGPAWRALRVAPVVAFKVE